MIQLCLEIIFKLRLSFNYDFNFRDIHHNRNQNNDLTMIPQCIEIIKQYPA